MVAVRDMAERIAIGSRAIGELSMWMIAVTVPNF